MGLWRHFGPQKDRKLTIFTKNDLFWLHVAYFDQIEPINGIFDNSYLNKSDSNKFWVSFKKIIFSSYHKILTYGVILAPKMIQFWPFPPKMTNFDQIDPINYTLHSLWKNVDVSLTLPRMGGQNLPPYCKKFDNFLCRFPTVLIFQDFS